MEIHISQHIKMKNYTEAEIHSLIKRFEGRVLPKIEWTHEAHLVVAIWYCFNYDFDTALNLVRENITRHNEAAGTINSETDGYHESITRFWLMVASNFLKTQEDESISGLCNKFINSDYGHSNYPLSYYSEHILFSVEARYNWIEPDLKKYIG
jgi:hypothetical protein